MHDILDDYEGYPNVSDFVIGAVYLLLLRWPLHPNDEPRFVDTGSGPGGPCLYRALWQLALGTLFKIQVCFTIFALYGGLRYQVCPPIIVCKGLLVARKQVFGSYAFVYYRRWICCAYVLAMALSSNSGCLCSSSQGSDWRNATGFESKTIRLQPCGIWRMT